MKRIIAWIIILVLAVPCFAEEEEEEQPAILYSMSNQLQGRIRPGKKYESLISFWMWEPMQPTGRTSSDLTWVEIETAEGLLVWCNVNYLTERRDIFHVYTLWDEGIRIRSKPGNGKVTGTAKKNQILEITQVVMGYGKCSRGWVDLGYFIEDCE